MYRLFGRRQRPRPETSSASAIDLFARVPSTQGAKLPDAGPGRPALTSAKPADLARDIQSLSVAGDHDGAEQAVLGALASHPAELGIMVAAAYASHRRGDWPKAAERWADIRAAFPSVIDAYVHAARACYMLGQHDAAQTLLDQAGQAFPDSRLVISKCQAYAAEARHDWRAAVHHWSVARALADNDAESAGALARTQYKLNQALADGATHAIAANEKPVSGSIHEPVGGPALSRDPADFLMRFESLGGNCELGLVQRHFRAEPVGLFRFGGIGIAKLTDGLRTGLPGLGDPANAEFTSTSDGCYDLRDFRSNIFLTHTHVKIGSVDEAKFFAQQCRRVRFLKDKLFEDLRAAEKIFVFKPEKGFVSHGEIIELHRVMLTYGPNTLLCMCTADAEHAPGTIARLRHDVYVGRLATVWDNVIPIEFETWLAVCRSVHEMAGAVTA